MAYYDANGKITIDENAAQYDINKINQAVIYLQKSKSTLNRLIAEAESTKGETGTAIVEKAIELRNQIDDMLKRLDISADFISKTVAHYKRLDQEVKDIISGQGGIK